MEFDAFDLEAVQDFLLEQLAAVRNYRKFCEQALAEHDGKSGTARMERYKTILMADFLKMQLEKVQLMKESL